MAEMEALKAELVSLKTGLIVELGEAMDARGFALQEHNTDKILGAMNKHFEKMIIMAENSTRALNEASALARRESSHAVICEEFYKILLLNDHLIFGEENLTKTFNGNVGSD